MEVIVKGIIIGTAVVAAVVMVAIEWWQHRSVPEQHNTYGQRRRRNE